MRISDGSSDVCSSDLQPAPHCALSGGHSRHRHRAHRALGDAGQRLAGGAADRSQGPGMNAGTMGGAPLLALRDLRVSFAATVVLAGVDLALAAGEVLALIGARGRGTTERKSDG